MFDKLVLSWIILFITVRIPYRGKVKQGHSFQCSEFMGGGEHTDYQHSAALALEIVHGWYTKCSGKRRAAFFENSYA
jgi:hypothetical protein